MGQNRSSEKRVTPWEKIGAVKKELHHGEKIGAVKKELRHGKK